MKQFKITGLLMAGIMLSMSSCLKEGMSNIATDANQSSLITLQFIEGGSGSTINSGLQYFSGGALTYAATSTSDTANINVSIAGTKPPANDVNVTIGVKSTALLDNYSTDSINYILMPDSLYKIINTTATVKAGTSVAPYKIVFYPSKVDPTKSYMLPITVTDAGGIPVSGNLGIVYFHIIGNPLAGSYNVAGTRYNYTGVIGYTGGAIPTNFVSTATSPGSKTAAPSSPTVIALDYANLGGSGYSYIITYREANPNNVEVSGNFLGSVSNFAVLVHTYDPVLRQIHIVSTYNNAAGGSGNDRIIDETFTHK